jgi:hypothetical protein
MRGETKVGQSLSGAVSPHASPSADGLPEFVIEYLAPERLEPHPHNFRRHPSSQTDALKASISEHGWLSAPIWNRQTKRLLDGHARVELALDQGEASIPVRVVDVPEAQEKRILAAFDRIGELRERDDAALAALLQDLAASEAGLPAGWEPEDLDKLLEATAPAVGPEEFSEYDEEIGTEFCCPKCGYAWSGKPA